MSGFLLAVCISGMAQDVEEIECILKITGAGDVEELDVDEVERLLRLLEHPIDLNLASGSRLLSSGLFTAYQIASLEDYRSRHGNVMSFMELSVVDGFNPDIVALLKPFIRLSIKDIGVPNHGNGVKQEVAVRCGGKGLFPVDEVEGGSSDLIDRCLMSYSYGMRYKIEVGPRVIGGLGFTRPFDGMSNLPSTYTGNLQWNFRKIEGKVIVGDFNARFGQGLALWNGMLMDNLNSPSAMMRKPTGLTRSASFTGSSAFTGAALELGTGPFQFSLAAASPLLGLANISWTGFNGKVSLTHVTRNRTVKSGGDTRTSVDAAFCFKGVNTYAEALYEWMNGRPSFLTGTDFQTGENVRTGVQVQCLPREHYCLAVSTAGNSNERKLAGTLSANATYYPIPKKGDEENSVQVKIRFDGEYEFSERCSLKVRVSERYRTWGNSFRTEVRTDMTSTFGFFTLVSRVNVLKCDGVSGLAYVEGACKFDELALYVRQGLFFVDDWDDRIYVYERDAPGSFNVPAMYGRGIWGNVVMSWKISRSMKMHLRAAYTSYVFMEEKKPGKAELKLHIVVRF